MSSDVVYKNYECVALMRQEMTPSEVHKLISSIVEEYIKSLQDKSEIRRREYWGLRTLSHEIKSNSKAHYVMICVYSTYAALTEIKRKCKNNENVLRYRFFEIDQVEGGPSAMMHTPDSSVTRSNNYSDHE